MLAASTSPSVLASPLAAEVARTAEDCHRLRSDWMWFPKTPGSDLGHLLQRAAVDPAKLRPHVVLLRHQGRPMAALAGHLERARLTTKIGYVRAYEPLVRSLVIPDGGVIGDLSSRTSHGLVEALWSSLQEGEADVAILRGVPVASPLIPAVRSVVPLAYRSSLEQSNWRWIATFPESPDAPFPPSKHARRHVRYYENRLRRKYDNDIVVRSGVSLEELVRDVEVIAARTYQRGIGVGFRDDLATRSLLRFEWESGTLRSWILYAGGQPAAFWLGLRHGETYHSGDTGYDPELREDRVGEILLLRAMADVRREGVRFFDFGVGDADYKRRYADRSNEVTTVVMFAPTARGVLRNLGRTTVEGTNRALQSLASRFALLQRLRTLARRRRVASC